MLDTVFVSFAQLLVKTPQDRSCQVDPVKQQVSLLMSPNIPFFFFFLFFVFWFHFSMFFFTKLGFRVPSRMS